MSTPWRGLEAIVGGVAVAATWRSHFKGAYEGLKAGFLQEGGTATGYPCPHGCGCVHDVVVDPEEPPVAVCTCDDWRCDDIPLRSEDIVLWQFSRARLGRAICRALDIERREVETGLFATTQTGTFAGDALPVFLSIQYEPEDLRQVITDLCLRHGKGFVLVIPSNQFIDSPCLDHLSRVNAGFLDLESHFELLPNGTLRSHRSAGELFSRYVTAQPQPLDESEAARLFALMRTLGDGDLAQKASLARVFRLLVLEGQSQEEAARVCECVPSLISRRAKTIETRMGLRIEQMRLYASSLRELTAASTPARQSQGDRETDTQTEEGGDD